MKHPCEVLRDGRLVARGWLIALAPKGSSSVAYVVSDVTNFVKEYSLNVHTLKVSGMPGIFGD